jgi:hypothetical protein
MRRLTPITLLLIAALTSLIASSCSREPAGGAMTAALAHETPASSFIGPEGGSLSTATGTSIRVPSGALAAGKNITITPSSSSEDLPTGPSAGSRYLLEPEGLTFSKPVTLTLAVDPSRIPSGKTVSDVVVYIAPKGSKDFTPLVTTPVDATHVTAQTTHFSEVSPQTPIPRPPGLPPPAPVPTTPTAPAPTSSEMTRPVAMGPKIPTAPPTAGNPPTNPKVGQGDWVCVAHGGLPEQRFYTAAECIPKCIGNITSNVFCQLDPTCPDLKFGGQLANTYETLYQQAAGAQGMSMGFGPSIVSPTGAFQISSTAWIIEKFFNQKATDFRITVNTSSDPSDWAHVDGAKAVFDLSVSSIGFIRGSPGAMASTLGHEMIHVQQRARKYTGPRGLMYFSGFQSVHDALWEHEAWSWESGPTYGHKWPDHNDSTLRCGTDAERAETQVGHDCYQWEVQYLMTKKAIENDADTLSMIDAFLQQDPWGQVWLKNNPDWKTWKTLVPSPQYTWVNAGGEKKTTACYCYMNDQDCSK